MRRFLTGFFVKISFIICAKFALILFLTLGNAFAQIPTNGLKGHWKFDGNANDASGNNNNGTLQGGAVFCEDRFGKENSAVKFGGYYNSSAIHIPNSPSLHLNSELTIACWTKLDELSGMDGDSYFSTLNCKQTFIAKDGDRTGFLLYHRITPTVHDNTFFIHNNTSCSNIATYQCTNQQSCTNKEWNHVAVVVENFSITMYINGKQMQKENYSSQIAFTKANESDLFFGRFGYNCNLAPYSWFPLNGKLDDIFYYNRALSQEEITRLYNYPAAYNHPPMITETISDNVCLGEKYEKNGFSLPEHQQVGLFTYTRSNGCDSTWILNLNVINCNPDPLDFDTYAVIICKRVILLNMKKLEEDGFDVTHCKWFKNGKEMKETNTINAFSYSEGPDKELETTPNYYSFRLITKNFGELPSTEKIIIHPDKAPNCPEIEPANNLFVYPNPVQVGSHLTIEGVAKGEPLYFYNYLGARVLTFAATDTAIQLLIDLPQGIYLLRTEEKVLKVVIVQ